MEGHLNKEYTLADLEPGWSEETNDRRKKTSMRMHGSMKMALLRVGKTPENSRRYVHGDPVTLIDWKAFARTDTLIVREQRDEASAQIVIVIDLGATMAWPQKEDFSEVIPKAELALRIGLWLSHTHLVMGDAVEVWLRKSDAPAYRWRPRSPADVMAVFLAAKANLVDRITDFFQPCPWSSAKNDILWLLTDGLERWDFDAVMSGSRRPIFIHTLSSLECDLGWMDDETCYLEREPIRKDYMGIQLKAGTTYQDKLLHWRQSFQKRLRAVQGDYFLATDKTAVGLFIHFLYAGGDK